jgi:hypothetical protein
MINPSQSYQPWMPQSMTFMAQSTTELLGFFAVGTPGMEPPLVLLDGVSLAAVPEPETLALLDVGLLGVLLARRPRDRCV